MKPNPSPFTLSPLSLTLPTFPPEEETYILNINCLLANTPQAWPPFSPPFSPPSSPSPTSFFPLLLHHLLLLQSLLLPLLSAHLLLLLLLLQLLFGQPPPLRLGRAHAHQGKAPPGGGGCRSAMWICKRRKEINKKRPNERIPPALSKIIYRPNPTVPGILNLKKAKWASDLKNPVNPHLNDFFGKSQFPGQSDSPNHFQNCQGHFSWLKLTNFP